MHVRHKLTAKQVVSLKQANVHSDGGGLYLRIRASGSKSWIFVKSVAGKRYEYGLGSAVDISLARARDRASKLREEFANGGVPEGVRQMARAEVVEKVCFAAFAEEFIKSISPGFSNMKHSAQWSSTIQTFTTSIANKPIADVNVSDLQNILDPIWLTKSETARRVRGRIERILDAAAVKGLRSGDNPAVLKGRLELLLPRQPKTGSSHHAALPYRSLPEFMKQLACRDGKAAKALQFTILTAARSGEVFGMTWSEVDIKNARWVVPAERMKARKDHIVPLNEGALNLIEAARDKDARPDRAVFHNGKGTKLSNMSMTAVLRRMERHDVTVHGFRSTFRDWVGEETDYPSDVAEMALAHTVGSKTERAYRRGNSFDKRIPLMEDWGRYAAG